MSIAQLLEKMIDYSAGNIHDIDHLIRVWTYAKTIGELEGLDANAQFILETAAITHDIACPLCREKYGNTNGKYQEQEAFRWSGHFCPTPACRRSRLSGSPIWWGITTPIST